MMGSFLKVFHNVEPGNTSVNLHILMLKVHCFLLHCECIISLSSTKPQCEHREQLHHRSHFHYSQRETARLMVVDAQSDKITVFTSKQNVLTGNNYCQLFSLKGQEMSAKL